MTHSAEKSYVRARKTDYSDTVNEENKFRFPLFVGFLWLHNNIVGRCEKILPGSFFSSTSKFLFGIYITIKVMRVSQLLWRAGHKRVGRRCAPHTAWKKSHLVSLAHLPYRKSVAVHGPNPW